MQCRISTKYQRTTCKFCDGQPMLVESASSSSRVPARIKVVNRGPLIQQIYNSEGRLHAYISYDAIGIQIEAHPLSVREFADVLTL